MADYSASFFFWLTTWVWMTFVLLRAIVAVSAARQRELRRHERIMKQNLGFLFLFVLLYVGKIGWLGKEPVSTWPILLQTTLRIHEVFIALMLVSGGFSLGAALKGKGAASGTEAGTHWRKHRQLGYVAMGAGLCAYLTASIVLAGMALV
jgi:uncharacterized membrane protein YozB (DUF420 family)